MGNTSKYSNEWCQLMEFSKGATFGKMDLHTHGPGSECSDFTLPAEFLDLFPKTSSLKNKKKYIASFDFLCSVAEDTAQFERVYSELQAEEYPRLVGLPDWDSQTLKNLVLNWLNEINLAFPVEETKSSKSLKARNALVERAYRDLRNYLKMYFFPEEYILRCYIEELELVALTDHNHPGYIILRQMQIGTWFSALHKVNLAYLNALSTCPEIIRKLVIQRLKLAKKRLKAMNKPDAAEKDRNHKDHQKKLAKLIDRIGYVNSRIEYWESEENILKPLIVLPGTEITVSNVHILAIFPPNWYTPSRIAGILRTIGIPEDHWGKAFKAAATASVQDTLDLVSEMGGIAIPAHANSDHKGLLRLFKSGLALNKVLNHPTLLALETTGGSVLHNKKPGKMAWEALQYLSKMNSLQLKPLCFVKNSDAHECRIERDGKGEDLGARYTNVKLDIKVSGKIEDSADDTFRALRLALLSGQNRIIEYPVEDGFNYWHKSKAAQRIPIVERVKLLNVLGNRPIIHGIFIEGKDSYADGIQLRFNPFLNCFIGSGGKSTILRTIGYAFGVLEFLPRTAAWWLPTKVTVYWTDENGLQCVSRIGSSVNPNAKEICVEWLCRDESNKWQQVANSPSGKLPCDKIMSLAKLVHVWPNPDVQKDRKKLSKLQDFEKTMIGELENALTASFDENKPLLINQPRDFFDNSDLYHQILSKPRLKRRQILWSTGSPAIPIVLDAEKIFVFEEKKGRNRKKRAEFVCAGDMHATEIRDHIINHFEGGWLSLHRRNLVYSL